MKQVIVLSGLLSIALVGSYLTWTQDDEALRPPGEVEVYKASATDLGKLTWKSDKATIEVERKSDEKGDYIWIVSNEKRITKPKITKDDLVKKKDDLEGEDDPESEDDSSADESSEDEGEEVVSEEVYEIKVTRFRGNKAAEDMWDQFAPLVAMRQLGTTADLDMTALGFVDDPPPTQLTIGRAGGPLELTVGGETYGSKDRYVRVGDKVFLVDDATLRPLQYATTRLVERSVQPLAEADIDRIEVRLPDGRAASMVQHNADDRAKAFWAMGDAAEEDATAGTWIGKLLKVRINAYVPEDEVEGNLVPVFAYAVHGDGEMWSVEVMQVDGDDDSDYYARPEYSRSMVKLTRSLVADAAEDLEAIFPE